MIFLSRGETFSMTNKISIIVPVYNVELYLCDCIDSILKQSFDAYEIICVEDCSTDKSYDVLCRHYKDNEHIRIIRHNHNMGLSVARNTGLQHASGKYILFVDSDDMLVQGALSMLYETAERMKTDVLYFDYEKIYNDEVETGVNSRNQYDVQNVVTGRKYFCESIKKRKLKVEVCRQFFRHDFIREHTLEFMPGIVHEDNLFSFQAAFCAERVADLNQKLYLYRQRRGSIMSVRNSKRAQSLFVIILEIFTYWNTHEFNEDESKCIARYIQDLVGTFQALHAMNRESEALEFGTEQEKALYNIIYNNKNDTLLELGKLDIEWLLKQEKIIVYGAGKAAYQLITYLKNAGVSVLFVMVENKNANPQEFCNCKVKSITDCKGLKENCVIIIGITNKNAKGVKDKLRAEGFQTIIELEDRENNP